MFFIITCRLLNLVKSMFPWIQIQTKTSANPVRGSHCVSRHMNGVQDFVIVCETGMIYRQRNGPPSNTKLAGEDKSGFRWWETSRWSSFLAMANFRDGGLTRVRSRERCRWELRDVTRWITERRWCRKCWYMENKSDLWVFMKTRHKFLTGMENPIVSFTSLCSIPHLVSLLVFIRKEYERDLTWSRGRGSEMCNKLLGSEVWNNCVEEGGGIEKCQSQRDSLYERSLRPPTWSFSIHG